MKAEPWMNRDERWHKPVITTKVRWGFRSKNQLDLFMVWREYRYDGEVEYATVLFSSKDWIGF